MKVTTRNHDPVEWIDSDEKIKALLEAAFEDGHPEVIAATVGNIARAMGMGKVAISIGRSRPSLYKSLSPEGNPDFRVILDVLDAIGYQLKPIEKSAA